MVRKGAAWLRDGLAGLVVGAVAEIELVLLDPDRIEGPVAGHHLLNLLIVPSFALRRVTPVGSIAVASLGFAVQPLLGSAPTATPYLALLFLLASLGWYASTRAGAIGTLLVLVSGLSYDLTTDDFRWADLIVNTVIIVAAWGAARGVRTATDRRVSAEVDADRQARAAAEAERTRIAQDLHDSLAHALTLMTLQAGSARERADQPLVAEALSSIEHSGREALSDMQRFLGLLGMRDGEAPGIPDLPDLAASVQRGGLAVDLRVESDPVPLSVSTTVYRVVQEALTNVVRHSDAQSAEVHVSRSGREIVAVVRDEGRGAAPKTTGSCRGIAGLRERIALFEGTLVVGATDDGWRLEARIPLPEVEP